MEFRQTGNPANRMPAGVQPLDTALPLNARCEWVKTSDGEYYWKDDWRAGRFTDYWKGGPEWDAYAAKAKTMTKGGLRAHAAGVRGEIALACGVSAAFVALTAAADTTPVLGAIARGLTTRTATWEENDEHGGTMVFSAIAGGAISSVLSTLNLGFMELRKSKITQPYLLTREAYWATEGMAADYFSRESLCRKSLDKLAILKNEMHARGMHENAKFSPWDPSGEPKTDDAHMAKTVPASTPVANAQAPAGPGMNAVQ